jgi:hypothetical protein
MISTVVELVGFALLVLAALVLFGVGVALAVAGVCCLAIGYFAAGLPTKGDRS